MSKACEIATVHNMLHRKTMPDFEKFSELLKKANGRNIAIVGHMRPDGDCVSSQFAMAEILKNAGANVVCLNKNNVPFLYKNLAQEEFIDTETFTDESWDILLVDCSEIKRASETLAQKFDKVFACIDHHASSNSCAQINIIDVNAGATAEIIALAVKELDITISKQCATLLLMGIATDTRQFTTTSTRLESFEAARELVKRGAIANDVAQELYQRERPAKMRLLANYLNSLEMYHEGKICFGFIPLGTFEKTGSCKEDTDGLVDFARAIDGVEIAATLEELADGSVKGSLRGKTPNYRVNEIAGFFGGGGHLAAAGFTAKNETFATIIPKLIELCKKHLEI